MGEMTLTLTPGHGYIFLTAVASGLLIHLYGAGIVVKARKKYGIKHPALYAPPGHKHEREFNCCQRAHQNSLENYPTFLLMLLLGSVKRPELAAIFGLVRLAGFAVYMHGYSTGDPAKRLRGAFGYLGLIGLIGLTLEVAHDLLLK